MLQGKKQRGARLGLPDLAPPQPRELAPGHPFPRAAGFFLRPRRPSAREAPRPGAGAAPVPAESPDELRGIPAPGSGPAVALPGGFGGNPCLAGSVLGRSSLQRKGEAEVIRTLFLYNIEKIQIFIVIFLWFFFSLLD